ncbi:MAG: GlsB/YeaQ/YmgE family stress response membrane protein [Desulfobacteraceae bacterium]|nr:GlsB/YeaQ/YmgE family stress response membrane protein [Desulfobacteraceae bacterium]
MHISITSEQVIVWLIIGGLAGFIIGLIFKGKKKGFGFFNNLLIGLIGAVIGGFIFDVFNVRLGLGQVVLSFDDLIAAVAGSIILLIVVAIIRR